MPVRVEDAFGRAIWEDTEGDAYGALDETKARCLTRLRFAGHFHDQTLGLFYNRFRDYDPALGRYVQPDPLGHAGGINLFAYPANPLACVDLRGLVHKSRDGETPDPQKRNNENGLPNQEAERPAGRRRDAKGQFEADPDAPKDGRVRREDVYPTSYRASTHHTMAIRHTEKGERRLPPTRRTRITYRSRLRFERTLVGELPGGNKRG